MYINDIPVGRTPYQNIEIPTGKHKITVVLSDEYLPHSKEVLIDPINPQILKFTLSKKAAAPAEEPEKKPVVPKDAGNVQLASVPTGAEIYINGEKRRNAPIGYSDMKVGPYEIEFVLGGKSLKGTFEIIKDTTVKLIADFEKGVIVNKWEEEQARKEEEALMARAKGFKDRLTGAIDDFKKTLECGRDARQYCCYSGFSSDTILSSLKTQGKFDASCADSIQWTRTSWARKHRMLHFRILMEYEEKTGKLTCFKHKTETDPGTKEKELSIEKCFELEIPQKLLKHL